MEYSEYYQEYQEYKQYLEYLKYLSTKTKWRLQETKVGRRSRKQCNYRNMNTMNENKLKKFTRLIITNNAIINYNCYIIALLSIKRSAQACILTANNFWKKSELLGTNKCTYVQYTKHRQYRKYLQVYLQCIQYKNLRTLC